MGYPVLHAEILTNENYVQSSAKSWYLLNKASKASSIRKYFHEDNLLVIVDSFLPHRSVQT